MDAATLRHLLGWGVVVHYAILLVWFAAFVFAHDALYRLHRRWFRQLTPQGFDAVRAANRPPVFLCAKAVAAISSAGCPACR